MTPTQDQHQQFEDFWVSKVGDGNAQRLRQLELFLHNLADPMAVFSRQGDLFLCNQAWANLIGKKREDIMGRHLSDFCPGPVEPVLTRLQQIHDSGQPERFTDQAGSPSDPRWFSATYIPVCDKAGDIFAIQVVSIEITEQVRTQIALRESEARYRNLVENSPFALVIVQNKRLVLVNRALEELLGYSREELLAFSPDQVVTLIHQEDRASILRRTAKRLAGENLTPKAELRMIHRDGRVLWLEGYSRLTEHRGGPAIELQLYDITDRKTTEAALVNSLEEKEVLLKEIHHRVKNNMQVVQSLLSLQANQNNNPVLAEAFQQSQSRIEAMALIHETLHRSNSLSEIDLSEYLRRLSEELRSIFPDQGAYIEIRLTCQPVMVDIELAAPLGMALNELISNSLKHAFPGRRRGRVEIEVRRLEEGKLFASIRDDGVGLPPRINPRNVSSLGLMLVTGLVEDQLGGRLEIREHQGACFHLTCPIPAPRRRQ